VTKRVAVWAALCFASLAVAAVGMELWGSAWRDRMQTRAVPSGMLNNTATGRLFARLGLLYVVPNDGQRYKVSDRGKLDLGTGLFPRRRDVGLQLFSTTPVRNEQFPSSIVVPAADVARGLPLLSIVVLPRDLYDPKRGLFKNVLEKGRKWERPAFISYFENGKLLFASGAGLRLHGGLSRHAEKKSFRLLFRDEYGAVKFPAGLMFGPDIDPVTSFVLDGHLPDASNVIDPVALDVSRMVGAIAPESKLVRLYLNGVDMGVYAAMEHVSLRYMRAHYGHDRFTIVRTKLNEIAAGRGYDYWLFYLWVREGNFGLRELSTRIDVENFARWVISVMLCLTVDHDQGPAVRDDSKPDDGRWFYINWDMDTSFGVEGRKGERPWESDDVRVFGLGTLRKRLLTIAHQDPEWRRYFVNLFVNVLNHEFTRDRVAALLKRYDDLVDQFAMSDQDRRAMRIIRRVLEERPPVMRAWLTREYKTGPAHRVTIDAPTGMKLEIDGYDHEGDYAGWYFAGTPLRIAPAKGDGQIAVRGWRVNGKYFDNAELALPGVSVETVIEPVGN